MKLVQTIVLSLLSYYCSSNYGSHPASELWHGIGAHQYYSPFDDKEPNNALFDNSSFVDG